MKLFKRLKHDATEMTDAHFGWDLFRAGDYSQVDIMAGGEHLSPEEIKAKMKIGHAIIFAINIGPIKLFKRLFIGI